MDDCTNLASRRSFLTGLTGASLLTVTGLGAVPDAEAAIGSLSGLRWPSGCGASGIEAFERFRNRKADTITLWGPRKSWSAAVQLPGGLGSKSKAARLSLGFAVLPDTHSAVRQPGNWKLAAKGSFDGYYTQYARNLAASGRKNLIVRIGWETNRKFPWYGGADPQGFKDTFKRVADILRRHNPSLQTEWCNIKKGSQKGSVLTLYPGDDAVDIISCDYYDGWPALNTEKIWDQQYNSTHSGGPWGIGSWLSFARSRGKKFACPEWGISTENGPGTKDNPLYIRKMHEFFSRNAQYIAYENYFNQKSKHQLTPSHVNPKASAEYRRLWGR